MADTKVRVNTLKFSFGRDSSEPTDAEMFEFCRERRFNPEEIYSIHKEKDSMAIFVKFKSESFMKRVLRNTQPVLTFNYANGNAASVTVSEADNSFKYVRVFNLPPEIEEKEIYQALSPYGIIRQQVREKYHPSTGFPVFSTVRGLYMEVTREIPPQIRIRHFQARIYHDGMVNKCFLCKSTEHVKANCPKRNVAQSSVQGRLYSDIVEARDLRPDFAKRMEESQLECQMTVLRKQSEPVQSEQCASGSNMNGTEENVVTESSITEQREVGAEKQTPAVTSEEPSPLVQGHGVPIDVDSQQSDEQDQSSNQQPFVEQKTKKRGRKKNRSDKDESSNDSDPETIRDPGSVSLLEAQQRRTRSSSKQPRIDQADTSTDDQLGAVSKTSQRK